MAERRFQYISALDGTTKVFEGISALDLSGTVAILYGEGGAPNAVAFINLAEGDVIREIA